MPPMPPRHPWVRTLYPAAAILASVATACGAPAPKAASDAASEEHAPLAVKSAEPESEGTPKQDAAGDAPTGVLPTQCSVRNDDLCVPPGAFVKRLCNGNFADVALLLFQGPWSRGFLTRKTEAWNAAGGASVQGWLEFDEEVLILRAQEPDAGGIQVSGEGTSYLVLRWNGSCASLSGEELTRNEPPQKGHSRIEWQWIGESMREALRKGAEVNETYLARRKECKGVTVGDVSKKCEQLDQKLVRVIVDHVRQGGALGTPDQIP